MKEIPERIYQEAEKYGGIPIDFFEDADTLVMVMKDGRKIKQETVTGTKKRALRAEAEQAVTLADQAETEHKQAQSAERQAHEAMTQTRVHADKLRADMDGPAAPPARTATKSEPGPAKPKAKQ
jgi:hypothetical protein